MRLVLLTVLVMSVAGCTLYGPPVVDCKVQCSADGKCPSGTACTAAGYCRPPNATGGCECVAGDQRPCGRGVGACTKGVQSCASDGTWNTTCVGEGQPTAELCDGKDNDCNGLVDDLPTDLTACPLTRGVCAGSMHQCVDGGQPDCGPANYGANYQVKETACDGLDNDCDGETDVTPAVTVTSKLSHEWFVLGYDGGYAVVYTNSTTVSGARGDDVFVARYDRELNALGNPRLIKQASRAYFGAGNVGETVYFVGVRGDAEALRVDLAGTIELLPTYLDAGFSLDDVRTGIGSEFVVAYTTDPNKLGGVREVAWPLDGGAPRVVELLDNDAGVTDIAVSSGGRFVYSLGVNPLDGGVDSYLQSSTDGTLVRPDAPVCSLGSSLLELGARVVATTSRDTTNASGIYFNADVLTQADADTVPVVQAPSAGQWGQSDSVVDEQGQVLIAAEDILNTGLTVARAVPDGGSWVFVTHAVQETSTSGQPQVALSPGDPLLGVAQYDNQTTVTLRRVCRP
jgi:hypothetical protein